MGRAKEGFLPSRTSEPSRLNLLLHQQQGGNAAPPDPQRCRENDHGSDFEKHPVFLKLSICLHGQRQLFSGFSASVIKLGITH